MVCIPWCLVRRVGFCFLLFLGFSYLVSLSGIVSLSSISSLETIFCFSGCLCDLLRFFSGFDFLVFFFLFLSLPFLLFFLFAKLQVPAFGSIGFVDAGCGGLLITTGGLAVSMLAEGVLVGILTLFFVSGRGATIAG